MAAPSVNITDHVTDEIAFAGTSSRSETIDGTAAVLAGSKNVDKPSWQTVSTYTIWHTLHAAGLSWQKTRTWCDTGVVRRRRGRGGAVTVTDPDAAAKKS